MSEFERTVVVAALIAIPVPLTFIMVHLGRIAKALEILAGLR